MPWIGDRNLVDEGGTLSPPLLPFLLLLCAPVDGGLAQLLGHQQAHWWGTSLGAAGASWGQGAGGQLPLIPPEVYDLCGAAGTGGYCHAWAW